MNNTIYGGTTATPTPVTFVDQTYDATSPNAQSGKAVEQALNQYPETDRFMSGVMGLVNRNGYTPTEKEYNPLSENAQSGKAVAEALATVGDAPKNYEKIATITVSPDTDGKLPTSIVFSADTSGKAFELTDFYIKGLIGATDGSSAKAVINVNGKAAFGGYTFGSTLNATSLRSWYMQWINLGENNGALCIAPAGTLSATKLPTASNANFQTLSGGLILPSFEGYVPIKNITIILSAGTAKTWIEGSTFELWGVRK